MPEAYKQRIAAMEPQFRAIAEQIYGVQINSGPKDIRTRTIHVGAKYAEENGQGTAYHDKVFRAYWQQAQAINDIEFLQQTASALGLDAQAFSQALSDPVYNAKVAADIGLARAYNITSVPTMVFNSKYLITGAQPYEELTRIIAQIIE